jgi:hypothetical protein
MERELVDPRNDSAWNSSAILLPILAILEMTLVIIASFPVNQKNLFVNQ